MTVTIEGVNDAPIAMNDDLSNGAFTDAETAVTINVLGNDFDIDNGDQLMVLSVNSIGTLGTVLIQQVGQFGNSVIYNPNGQFDHLIIGQSLTDTFTYTVRDIQGELSSATVVVTINGLNEDPIAVSDTASTNEDTPVTITNLLDNDNDPEGFELSIIGVNTSGTAGTAVVSQDVFERNLRSSRRV